MTYSMPDGRRYIDAFIVYDHATDIIAGVWASEGIAKMKLESVAKPNQVRMYPCKCVFKPADSLAVDVIEAFKTVDK